MRHVGGLEVQVEKHDVILNNKSQRGLRPTRRNMTYIINFTFTTPEIGALDTWVIDEKLSML